jgi:pimeloyl-ACP methyl ester carboxylesterase
MGELNVEDIQLGQTDPAAARAKTEADRLEILDTSADDLAAALQSVLTPVDAAALTGDLAEYFTQANQAGLAPGIEGWWDDGVATDSSDWGFDLGSISIPLLLMHGRHDRFVPFAHGQWLARQIPGVEARLLDDDGHLTLLKNRIGEVHAWLLAHLPA